MRLLGLLALGHMVIDINQGSLAAILPFLKSSLALSFTATGAIVLVANTTSSLIQPLFGYFADKTSRRWLLPLSVALSAIGIGLIGLAPSYAAVLALVVITGFGVAAYHPEGYRTATAVAGDKKATGVSVFSTGGNIGIAVGPLLADGADHALRLAGQPRHADSGAARGGLAHRGPADAVRPRRPCAPRRALRPAPHDGRRDEPARPRHRASLVDAGRVHDLRALLLHRGAARRSHHGRDPARRLPRRRRARHARGRPHRRPRGHAPLHGQHAAADRAHRGELSVREPAVRRAGPGRSSASSSSPRSRCRWCWARPTCRAIRAWRRA